MHYIDWQQSATARRRAASALKWSIGVTLALYLIPFGALLAYPLLLLSTIFHELGHGLLAIITGGDFKSLTIFADGSGVATHTSTGSATGEALTAAGGLVGPAVVAGLAFAASRSTRGARVFLVGTSAALVLALATVVHGAFAIGFTGVVAATALWLGVRCSPATAQFGAVFGATQLALSVFSRGDYLFTASASTGIGVMPSDTAAMAEALGGTYWLWGIACGLFSVAVLALGATWYLRALEAPARPGLRIPTP